VAVHSALSLAAFNVTLAAYAVWRIACLTVGEARAPLVAAIYWLSPYTVWHAVKFDHNAILLSTWPLVVWAFLLSVRDPKWWRGLILGLARCMPSIRSRYSLLQQPSLRSRAELLLLPPGPGLLLRPRLLLCASRRALMMRVKPTSAAG